MTKFTMTVCIIGPEGKTERQYQGRDAWALNELIEAGGKGVTPLTHPAPRWSAYIFNLRQTGLAIDTIHEPHQGRFPGTHGRYVLRSTVVPIPANDEGSA